MFLSLLSVKTSPLSAKEIIFYDETMETVMEKFENSGSKILPVLKNGKFIGFISKHFVLIKYREKLKDMIIE